MPQKHWQTLPVCRLFRLLLGLTLVSVARAQDPHITYSKFTRLPRSLNIFEDATSMLYHNMIERNVYVSHDDGKSWSRTNIPLGEASEIVLHPYDNRYAFILSRNTTHYRTSDRGRTWQTFTVSTNPVFYNIENPVLSFHVGPASSGYILFSGRKCDERFKCHSETYYTRDAFSTEPTLLLPQSEGCKFAHSSKELIHDLPHDYIFCTVLHGSGPQLRFSSLIASNDFFETDHRIVDIGTGQKYFNSLSFTGKFASFQASEHDSGETQLYVSLDPREWSQTPLPMKNGYISKSMNQQNTEKLVVASVDIFHGGGGSTWNRVLPPAQDASHIGCDPSSAESCSLHLYNFDILRRLSLSDVTHVTRTSALGLVLGVGSIGSYRKLYIESDTFLSTDAGLTWRMIRKGPHKYAIADHGSVLVLVEDIDEVDEVLYSNDDGRSWQTFTLERKLRPAVLTSVANSTSQKFILVGVLTSENKTNSAETIVVYLDFAPLRGQQCKDDDFEKWYIQDNKRNGLKLTESLVEMVFPPQT
ncbi:hypothetical protein EW145_g6082 [Phellinidium pouzarii]|uniref:VPS10 domain-containing protein n=1 Tax=Phellinidium pouzarii TaxID=167371 RepID=A0A4V3XBX8_9AGAM|nr:hypothetical protein EW145_g6082 [Phellinidium pouzarii]